MRRAFIIDDEPGIRLALRRWFERAGYAVVEASTGEEALAQLSAAEEPTEASPAVIICDINLPGLSGEELLGTIGATRPGLAARFILTTGDSIDDATAGSALARHPFVLQKPFDLATLKSLVELVLRVA